MRALCCLLLISCASGPPPQPWTDVGPSRVLEILVRHQCATCHSVESVFGSTLSAEAEPRPEACFREGLCAAPTLSSMERFRASWLRAFLASAVDVRPGLDLVMPPHALTAGEVDALLVGWGAVDDDRRLAGRELERGEALFRQKQCGVCHQFGPRALVPGEASERLRALAPDLQHTRQRLNLDIVARFIFSPAAVKPATEMPRPAVTLDEAQALARFIVFAE